MSAEVVPERIPARGSRGFVTSDSSVLDFLRSVAVSLVFLAHILEATRDPSHWWRAQRLGWMGVMLFFVHTSLVLMFSLDRTPLRGTSLLSNFYLRRAFRIYPLSIAIVGVILLFGIPVASWPWRPAPLSTTTVVANLLLVQNLVYAPSVLGPLWSLPLELQMYVLLPFLYWLVRRGTRLDVAATLWVLAVGLAFLQPLITDRANVAQYAPCFMGGILAFCLSKRRPAVWPFWTWGLTLGAAILAFLALTADRSAPHVMGASWALTLVIGVIVPNFAETKSVRIHKLCATIAKYSYGIYLTHMITFWIVFVRLAAFGIATRLMVGVVLAVLLPVLSYHLVEAPGIRLGGRLAARLASRRVATQAAMAERDRPIAAAQS
jgi:peptidoglycan/LPS O-acetylase OafA/YrhL